MKGFFIKIDFFKFWVKIQPSPQGFSFEVFKFKAVSKQKSPDWVFTAIAGYVLSSSVDGGV